MRGSSDLGRDAEPSERRGSDRRLINPVGDTRLPNDQNIDLHVERPIRFNTARFIPSLDIFNVLNANTVQPIRSRQNASNANQIQAILAPRVLRFGIRVNW